jgi:transcriptional/translational regulatory protein YebC/TACO1
MSPTAFLFERKGVIRLGLGSGTIDREGAFDLLFEVAVEAGAEDVRVIPPNEDDRVGGYEVSDMFAVCWVNRSWNASGWLRRSWLQIITPPSEVSTIASSILSPFTVTGVEVAYLASTPLRLPPNPNEQGQDVGDVISEEVADKVFNLVEGLEETGDVVKVWTNVVEV